MKVLTYPTSEFPLAELVGAALGHVELSRLHELPELAGMHWLDAMHHCVRRVEAGLRSDGLEGYDALVGWVLDRLGLDATLLYQRPPSVRVHLVGGRTASAPHRDRDHTTSDRYLNVWVPLVDVAGANSLFVEGADGLLEPQRLVVGELLCFNGRDLLHGSRENTTETTRVSFDLRVIGVDPSAFS